jgi:hypothetical protein
LKKKIPESFHDRLLDSELTEGEYNGKGEFIYTGSPVFIDTVLNLVGRAITNEHRNENWCLAINSQDEARINLKPFPQWKVDSEPNAALKTSQEELSLQIGVPTPVFSDEITIAEIIALRQKNETAFFNFRMAAERLTTGSLGTNPEEYLESYLEAVRKLSEQAQGRWSSIKLEKKYFLRTINPTGISKSFKNLRDPTAALALAGTSLTAITGVQDIYAGGAAGITAFVITGAATLINVRKDSPVCWLKHIVV